MQTPPVSIRPTTLAQSWWQRITTNPSQKLEQKRQAAAPVLIFQFGKVGSSSLLDSLAPQWPGLVVHAHTLKERDNEPAATVVTRDILRQKTDPVFVITTVRDPIARNISAFFQNFERETGVHERQCHTIPIKRLIEIFLAKYPHNIPLTWFDEHLKPATGIDVFEHDFPGSGVQLIEHGNVHLLLMLSEIPDWQKESAVRRFLGLETFRLRSSNVGSAKPYAATYRNFLQTFTAPDWYLQQMYSSRFFQHFYSLRKEPLIAQWTSHFDAGETCVNGTGSKKHDD